MLCRILQESVKRKQANGSQYYLSTSLREILARYQQETVASRNAQPSGSNSKERPSRPNIKLNNAQQALKGVAHAGPKPAATSARAVSEDILRTLAASPVMPKEVEEVEEISRNEMLHERKKVNQAFKQKTLQNKYGPQVTQPAITPNNVNFQTESTDIKEEIQHVQQEQIRTLADYLREQSQETRSKRYNSIFADARTNGRLGKQRSEKSQKPPHKEQNRPEEPVRTLKEYEAERKKLEQQQTHRFRFQPEQRPTNHSNNNSISLKKPRVVVEKKSLVIPIPAHGSISLRSLSQSLGIKMTEVNSRLAQLGDDEAVKDNSKGEVDGDRLLDGDLAELLLLDLGHTADRTTSSVVETQPKIVQEGVRVSRAPTVCVIGHVDHGKTTLLDTIRGGSSSGNSNHGKVETKEAGGITQRLAAFTVQLPTTNSNANSTTLTTTVANKEVVFIDTPGHFAFSSMRKQASCAADIAILCIALDEGVKPQTIDAARSALTNSCSILIALTKADRIPDKNERERLKMRVLSDLAEKTGVLSEELGGPHMSVILSSYTKENIPQLLELLSLQADILELTAVERECSVEAVVLDCQVSKGRGVSADLLIKQGTLSVGDHIVAGISSGRVKAIFDESGRSIPTAKPAQPVRVLGLKTLPPVGDELVSVGDVEKAKAIVERRMMINEKKQMRLVEEQQRIKLEMEEEAAAVQATSAVEQEFLKEHDQQSQQQPKVEVVPLHLTLLLKADGLGSLEALRQLVDSTIAGLQSVICEDPKQQLPHIAIASAEVGAVTTSDIDMVSAMARLNQNSLVNSKDSSKQQVMVLAFNVGAADGNVKAAAKERQVDVITGDVIYRLEDALRERITALLPRNRVVEKIGTATVSKVFHFKDSKSTVVAGLNVTQGRLATATQLTKEDRESAKHSISSSSEKVSAADASVYYRITRKTGTVLTEQTTGHSDLKRFKDSVGVVNVGSECGLSIQGFTGFEEGDVVECFAVYNRLQSLPSASHNVSAVIGGNNSYAHVSTPTRAAGAKAAGVVNSAVKASSSTSASGKSNNAKQQQQMEPEQQENRKVQRAGGLMR